MFKQVKKEEETDLKIKTEDILMKKSKLKHKRSKAPLKQEIFRIEKVQRIESLDLVKELKQDLFDSNLENRQSESDLLILDSSSNDSNDSFYPQYK